MTDAKTWARERALTELRDRTNQTWARKRARWADLIEQQAAELAALRETNERFGKRQEWWTDRMFALEQERDVLRAELSRRTRDEVEAAVSTLKALGYTYEGGERWKPPLGTAPDFYLIDSLRAAPRRR